LGEGCAQLLFIESDEVCETSYKDRGGKGAARRDAAAHLSDPRARPQRTRVGAGPTRGAIA
jgi:hypothetical protein